MDSRKLERILIGVLLLLNLFLLSAVLLDGIQDRRSRRETAQTLTALLEESGITADARALAPRACPVKYTLTRDLASEARIVSNLIGSAEAFDRGGNILSYVGTKGKAQIRGSGEMDMLLDAGAAPVRGSALRTAQRLARRAGIGVTPTLDGAADDGSVSLWCTRDGCPVYNAVLSFDFVGGSVSMISGTRLFDTATAQDGAGLMDSVSVLVRFLSIVRDEGFICSHIESVTPGYLQTVARSGEAELAPVWRIVTDTGVLMIDAETGKTEGRLS